MMKKQITLVATAAILAFSGCGDDRSHPKSGVNGKAFTDKLPIAIIDLNNTTHTYVPALNQYTVGGGARMTIGDPFIFTGTRSHDNDENNQSITTYAWSVSHSFLDACVDINTTANRAVFKFVNTDTNSTCQTEAINNGEINATLTVTDNEGSTASTTKAIKTN